MGNKRKVPKPVYFHGGVPGLTNLALLETPDEQKVKITYTAAESKHNPAYVYMTTDLELARVYAAQYEVAGKNVPGDVYRVRPVGAPRRDPDFPNASFMATGAVVLDIIEQNVLLTPREREERCGPYRFYAEGKPVYDVNGYMLPSPAMEQEGNVSAEFMRLYGPWIPFLDVNARGFPRLKNLQIHMLPGLLQRMPALDSSHEISSTNPFSCQCGRTLPTLGLAIWHQLGEEEMSIIGPVIGTWTAGTPMDQWSGSFEWATAAKELQPARWTWLP